MMNMKKFTLTSILLALCGGLMAQTQDLTMYITPDYGGCSGRIEFRYCNMTSFNILFDGMPAPGPGATVFSTICSGTHTVNFTGSNMSGDVYTFTANLNLSPTAPSVSITSASPVAPLTVIFRKVSASGSLCNGMAVAQVANGTGPYAIQWYDGTGTLISGATNDTLDNLCPGMIGLLVSDAFSPCFIPGSPVMRSIEALTCDITTNPVSCYDVCDATAVMTHTNFPTVIIETLTGPTQTGTTFISSECTGTVMGFVQDITNQVATCYAYIGTPPPIVITIDSVVHETGAASNGAIYYHVSPSSGYTVTWVQTTGSGSGTGGDTSIVGIPGGVYAVTATTTPGCAVTQDVTVGSFMGIDQVSAQVVNVYPNPFHSTLQVDAKGIEQITLTSVSGQQRVIPVNGMMHSFDLTSLPAGAYVLSVKLQTGEIIRKEILKAE